MWYEILDFIDVDLEKLQKEVKESVFTLGDQVIQGEEYETPQYRGFGGWSLTSRTGDWRDGFEFYQNNDEEATKSFFKENDNNIKALKFFNIAQSVEYKNPTQACVGEIKRVLDQIEAVGLYPRRARVTCLKAGCKSLVHTDGAPTEYIARIHIPIFTNPKCKFSCEGKSLYMEAGKVYMVWVNKWHQIRNDSDQDRYHIIMDAYDTKHITQQFKYGGDIQQMEEYAQMLRKQIDECVITDEEYAYFESIRQKYVTKKI